MGNARGRRHEVRGEAEAGVRVEEAREGRDTLATAYPIIRFRSNWT